MLRIVEGLAGDIPLHFFSNRAEVPESKLVRGTKIPLPPRPVVWRSVLFTLFSCFAYWLSKRYLPFLRSLLRPFLPSHFSSRASGFDRRRNAAPDCADIEPHLGIVYGADRISLRRNHRGAFGRLSARADVRLSRISWRQDSRHSKSGGDSTAPLPSRLS